METRGAPEAPKHEGLHFEFRHHFHVLSNLTLFHAILHDTLQNDELHQMTKTQLMDTL